MAIHEMRIQQIRDHEERTQARRSLLLDAMRQKRVEARQGAETLQHPYWKRKAAMERRSTRSFRELEELRNQVRRPAFLCPSPLPPVPRAPRPARSVRGRTFSS